MENKVYYGEYSLNYWIELILSKSIVLPEYQRSFVWKEDDIQQLVKSFKAKQFVQPVTIALMKTNSKVNGQNLILDGQQRLTTILLSKIGYIPDIDAFANADELTKEDVTDEGDDDSNQKKSIKWTFSQMLSEDPKGNTIQRIQDRVRGDGRYKELKLPVLSDKFYDNTFLGFSYIVPDCKKQEDVVQSFAQLFRNINYFGKHLSALESRRSLYYMNSDYYNFFEGIDVEGKSVLCDILIKEKMQSSKLDLVRYMAPLSQYHSDDAHDVSVVMKWYSKISTRESYYADYVAYILGLDQEANKQKFEKFIFKNVFSNHDDWKQRYSTLRKSIERLIPELGLNEDKSFSSLISADYWLYGLIYNIVFIGKKLNDDVTNLVNELKTEIHTKINDKTGYAKSPNQLGLLRDRIKKSVKIYSKYVH